LRPADRAAERQNLAGLNGARSTQTPVGVAVARQAQGERWSDPTASPQLGLPHCGDSRQKRVRLAWREIAALFSR
jgi:hypothetical protein